MKKQIRNFLLITLGLGLLVSHSASSYEKETKASEECGEDYKRFVFSWHYKDTCAMKPRGGSSNGVPVTLDTKIHDGWQAIQESGLSKFEKDRRAILAMAGPYRAAFNFLETEGFSEGYQPGKPYQSWATEYVYVIADEGDFISLQHVLVMMFIDEDGIQSDPVVVKHWRQDWKYQKRKLLTYQGHDTWKTEKISRREAKGTWAQAVYQVDDSPRYESFGKWEHTGDFSTWLSEKTWRPLPRREHTIRDDYHVLEGFNRHTITRTGWIHQQENFKVALNKVDNSQQKQYLSKELSVNRYDRIVDHDFSAGDEYWKHSELYWQDVRTAWNDIISDSKVIKIKQEIDGKALHRPISKYPKKLKGQPYETEKGQPFIKETLDLYLTIDS